MGVVTVGHAHRCPGELLVLVVRNEAATAELQQPVLIRWEDDP